MSTVPPSQPHFHSEPDQKPPRDSQVRVALASWLAGVRGAGVDLGYPGQRWGLPAAGTGAIAGWARRLAAFSLDWALCAAIAVGLLHDPGWSTTIFVVQAWFFTAVLGGSAGQLVLGVCVVRWVDLPAQASPKAQPFHLGGGGLESQHHSLSPVVFTHPCLRVGP